MSDIAQMLSRHVLVVMMKIARGTYEISRRHARDTFRRASRSAECCESVIERMQLAGIGDPKDLTDALEAVAEVRSGLKEILARIDAGLPQREIFQGM